MKRFYHVLLTKQHAWICISTYDIVRRQKWFIHGHLIQSYSHVVHVCITWLVSSIQLGMYGYFRRFKCFCRHRLSCVFSQRSCALSKLVVCYVEIWSNLWKKATNHKVCFTWLKTLILAIQPFGPLHVHSFFL